ncbi:hypothetical protein [Paenibacillus kribbensis]|uniref:hypothetical protein n=1 Tax=Paenibacillus kribbensis TaxID=172713 RepID=UPI00211773E0|nr:hypothetical protein [Paenibacillus kribbensis]
MSAEEQLRLLEWWQTLEAAHPIVQRLCSLVSELRLNPESSHAEGMILFYRAASEVSYGHAGVRGGIRRAFSSEYCEALRMNLVMCHFVARLFSGDTKVLLERVAKHITGPHAQQLVRRIRETLMENDAMINEMVKKAHAFFGKETFQALQMKAMQSMTLPMGSRENFENLYEDHVVVNSYPKHDYD